MFQLPSLSSGVWGGAMATYMAQGLLPVPGRCTLELTLTLGGQGAKIIHWAGASE